MDHYIGLSIALGASFILYALLKYIEKRKDGAGSVVRGVIIPGTIFLILYIFLGCADTIVQEYYVEKIGWVFIVIIKRLTLLITVISVITGYIYIYRKTRHSV